MLDSFFSAYRRVSEESVDLIVTSPPYLNNYHYNRNTRPQLYWLGLVESTRELKEIEQRNFGKFWQTVREQPNVELDPEIADPEIIDTLEELRSKTPEKGTYGGRGWANYATTYFNDCLRFARGAHWCLRPGASALVVIGNSILQGIPIPTDQLPGADRRSGWFGNRRHPYSTQHASREQHHQLRGTGWSGQQTKPALRSRRGVEEALTTRCSDHPTA